MVSFYVGVYTYINTIYLQVLPLQRAFYKLCWIKVMCIAGA